jgi:hypothetical protein
MKQICHPCMFLGRGCPYTHIKKSNAIPAQEHAGMTMLLSESIFAGMTEVLEM